MSTVVERAVSVERQQKEEKRPDFEDALFSSLLLLGLDPDFAEKKYGCSISREMFRTPNVKGMEVVLHYLLTRVSPEAKDVRFSSFIACHSALFSISFQS